MATIFGLAEYKGKFAGLDLQNVTYGQQGSDNDAINEDADVDQVDVHSRKKTFTANGNVKVGADLEALQVGASITLPDGVFKINKCDVVKSVTGTATCSLAGSAPWVNAAPAQG